MTLTDQRFAGEVLTTTGKTVVVDDVACLTAWLAEYRRPVASAWVIDFAEPTDWLRADSAVYLQSDTIRTPMSSGLIALRPGRQADSVRTVLGGRLLTWSEVLAARQRHEPTRPS